MADVTKRICTIVYISIDQMQRYHYHIPSFVIYILRFVSESFQIKSLSVLFSLFQVHIVIHVYSLADRNTLKQLPDVNEDKVDKSK